jgi:hypothetical protein
VVQILRFAQDDTLGKVGPIVILSAAKDLDHSGRAGANAYKGHHHGFLFLSGS